MTQTAIQRHLTVARYWHMHAGNGNSVLQYPGNFSVLSRKAYSPFESKNIPVRLRSLVWQH